MYNVFYYYFVRVRVYCVNKGFMGSGPAVVPQYYGVPWGMYPAGSIIQQAGAAGQPGAAANGTNTAQQQRRPMSPSQADGTQYQVIPAFYDQNGSLVMTRNGGQLRLVSPASVIVNAQQGTCLLYLFMCVQFGKKKTLLFLYSKTALACTTKSPPPVALLPLSVVCMTCVYHYFDCTLFLRYHFFTLLHFYRLFIHVRKYNTYVCVHEAKFH